MLTPEIRDCIERHPLNPSQNNIILQYALDSWAHVWNTTIGNTPLRLSVLNPSATVIGYFFEKVFAYNLAQAFPLEWRGGINKEDKDIVCIPHNNFSIEIKTSGQLGTKIYGNRSYGSLKNLNIPYRVLYQMRHSFASMMISNGEDILWVSNMLGHKDSSMTLEVYARYVKQNNKKRASFLPLPKT